MENKVSRAKNVKVLTAFVEKNKIPDQLLQSLSFKVFSDDFNISFTEEILGLILATYNLGDFDGYWRGHNDKEDQF